MSATDKSFPAWRKFAKATKDGKAVQCSACPKPATQAGLMLIAERPWDVPLLACSHKCKVGLLSGWNDAQRAMPMPLAIPWRLVWIDVATVQGEA